MLIEAKLLGPADELKRQRRADAGRERAVVIHQRPIVTEDQNAVVREWLGIVPAATCQLHADDLLPLGVHRVALELEPEPGSYPERLEVVLDQLARGLRGLLLEGQLRQRRLVRVELGQRV